MTTGNDSATLASPPLRPSWRRVLGLPISGLGWRSVVLLAIFAGLFLINSFVLMRAPIEVAEGSWEQILLIFYGFAMILCGFGATITGLIAVLRRSERSILVLLAFLPGLLMLFLLLGEILAPH